MKWRRRILELWASKPEAEAWLARRQDLTELTGKRQELLTEVLLRHGAAEVAKYVWGWRCSDADLLRGELHRAEERQQAAVLFLQDTDIREHCQGLAERLALFEAERSAAEAKSKVERLQLENAILQDRCEQLQSQVVRAEAQMKDAWQEKAIYKERCRQLERQLAEADLRQPEEKRMRMYKRGLVVPRACSSVCQRTSQSRKLVQHR